jgi:hypothetical protein
MGGGFFKEALKVWGQAGIESGKNDSEGGKCKCTGPKAFKD